MTDYVKKIRTEKGDLQIDYEALGNLPKSDATLTKSGSFADAKAVGDKITQLNNESLKTTLELTEMQTNIGVIELNVSRVRTSVTDLETKVSEAGYVTETQLTEKGYVTETQLGEKGYVTGSDLLQQEYVTKTDLTENLVASDTTPGVIKPGDGLSVSSDGTLSVDPHEHFFEELSNVYVVDAAPDTSTLVDGDWYLVKVEE